MSLKDKIPNLPNLSKIGTNKIKVYAFVGPSGTGKSYRAQMVASERNINYIIDDGLLIKENEVTPIGLEDVIIEIKNKYLQKVKN